VRPVRSLVGLAALTAIVLALTAAGLDAGAFAAAAALAVIPLPFYIGIALWLDRFEPEPRTLLAMAFLWGASVAVVVAGVVNAVMDAAVGEWWSSVATAPLIEELLKGYILFRFARTRKDEFDGVVDGVIYAAMVGLGFAFVENIDYYGRALAKEGAAGLAVTFTLRGVVAAFSHPLFTSMTGIGLGLARQSSRRWVQRVAPPLGLMGAIVLHGLWNAGASAGLVFFVVYVLIMVPALVALLVVAAVALKFEGRTIRTRLAGEAATGLFTPAEYAQLCSVRGRLHASASAFRHGGFDGWRKRRDYHRAASELAFLRQRAVRDGVAVDASLESAYLEALGAIILSALDAAAPTPLAMPSPSSPDAAPAGRDLPV
jgi:RsiW-degrading membrane proteinase PrsW (M82 family)